MPDRKKEIVENLEALFQGNPGYEKISGEVKKLRTEFTKMLREALETAKKEEDNAGGELKAHHDELDDRFSEVMRKINLMKQKWEEQQVHEQEQNLEVKRRVISELKKLIEEEQHIGHAFEKFNELKENWKKTGPVPSNEHRELHREYSHLIEKFFYNINIYKTLKEYDLQKNLQLKLELTEKVGKLIDKKNIKEMRDLISAYTKEWDDIGPTYQNQWEKVRDDFWENVRLVHKKIGDYYKDLKKKQKQNFEKKEKLCESLEGLLAEKPRGLRQWNAVMREMNTIRESWKKIGFAGKPKNEQVWKRFKSALNDFHEKRKAFQGEMAEVFNENEAQKLELIERAQSLTESMDWKHTAEQFKKLQSSWKRIGPASPSKEQKLWKKFRSASDYFFSQRKSYFDGREDREKENLKKKKELIKQLKSLDVTAGNGARHAIIALGREWNKIGYVPSEEKKKIEEDYHKIVAEKLKGVGLSKSEIEDQTFELKVEALKEASNSAELIRNEYQNLDEKLKKIEAHIKQYENNLGFFGGKTEGNPLVKEVVDKINFSKKEASKIRARLQKLKR